MILFGLVFNILPGLFTLPNEANQDLIGKHHFDLNSNHYHQHGYDEMHFDILLLHHHPENMDHDTVYNP